MIGSMQYVNTDDNTMYYYIIHCTCHGIIYYYVTSRITLSSTPATTIHASYSLFRLTTVTQRKVGYLNHDWNTL